MAPGTHEGSQIGLSTGRATLTPLFLISAAGVGYEIALTRLLRVSEMVRIRLLGDFHRDGRFRRQRRGAGAVARLASRHGPAVQAALPALLILTAASGFQFCHNQPVQSAATAEPGDVAAAIVEHRRPITRRCCRSSSAPACSSA